MAATIKDIARQLNISTSTVSYALNGGPRAVPDEVRERVLRTARELDYRPNRIARSLVTRRTNAIGIVPPATGENVFLSPFVRAAWNGLVNAAGPLGQDLLLFSGHNRNDPNASGDALLDGRIDGIVFIAPRSDLSVIPTIQARQMPFVWISGSSDLPGVGFMADNASGIRAAVDHVVELGHRRIAHISGPEDSADALERRAAFLSAMQEHGLPLLDGYLVSSTFTMDSGFEAGEHLLGLPTRPTAVIAANDECAFGFIRAARRQGLRVPEDISVTGFDDSDLSQLMSPPLTTVHQPIMDLARMAINAVVKMAQSDGEPKGRVSPTHLVVRESTARVPGGS